MKALLDFAHDVGHLRLRLDGLPNLDLYRRRPWSLPQHSRETWLLQGYGSRLPPVGD